MAEHHDHSPQDPLDNALMLLKARQWAGPATHPIVERVLMQARNTERPSRFRLVWGVGLALIGCGAVAAATRPVWQGVISPRQVDSQTSAPTRLAEIPAPAQPPARTQESRGGNVAEAPTLQPAPVIVQQTPSLAAAVKEGITFESMIEGPDGAGAAQFWTGAPVGHDYESLCALFIESLYAGDLGLCEALMAAIEAPPPQPFETTFRAYTLRLEDATRTLVLDGTSMKDGKVELEVRTLVEEAQGLLHLAPHVVVSGDAVLTGNIIEGGVVKLQLAPGTFVTPDGKSGIMIQLAPGAPAPQPQP